MTQFEQWLGLVDQILLSNDPQLDDRLDELVEEGLALTEATALSTTDHARLNITIARVTSGLAERRDAVARELDDLHRQRRDLTRSASGIAGYMALEPTTR